MSEREFSLKLRVYIEDTDAGGIVYYANYLKFMERARTEYMRLLGFGRQYIFNHDLMFVVRDASISYLSPARLDDELDVTASIRAVRAASIQMSQCVQHAGEPITRAELTLACVDRVESKPRRIPADMALVLRKQQHECETI
ncbi:MAG: tol-pal system-associated acyl-CoA thioesterase [Pseudomonadota bacterium]